MGRSPKTSTEYLDSGTIRATMTRHGLEDSSDYSATLEVFARSFPNAAGRAGAATWLRAMLLQLAADALAAAGSLEEE